jgi:uncharacterized protein
MKIIITGGTGLIGQVLTKDLAGVGHEVWVLSRDPSQAKAPAGTRLVKWDGKTPSGWQDLVEQADAVVNLAGANIGEARWTKERKKAFMESRQNVGRAVVAAVEAAAHKPGVVLQASAIGFYGPRDERQLEEGELPGNDFGSSIVTVWEDSTKPVEALGVRRVVVRTGLVLSARGGVLERMVLPFRLFAGGPLGSGKQWYSWIHLTDEVRALRYLLENQQARGTYNLTAPNAVTMAEFGKTLGKVMHRPYWAPVPGFVLKLLLGEMSTLVLDGQRVYPKRLLEAGFTFKFERLKDALTDLLVK